MRWPPSSGLRLSPNVILLLKVLKIPLYKKKSASFGKCKAFAILGVEEIVQSIGPCRFSEATYYLQVHVGGYTILLSSLLPLCPSEIKKIKVCILLFEGSHASKVQLIAWCKSAEEEIASSLFFLLLFFIEANHTQSIEKYHWRWWSFQELLLFIKSKGFIMLMPS